MDNNAEDKRVLSWSPREQQQSWVHSGQVRETPPLKRAENVVDGLGDGESEQDQAAKVL